MLNRWRLPADDYPDETESPAFQNYVEGVSGPGWQLPFYWQQWLLYGAVGLLVLGVSLGSLYVYRLATDGTSDNSGSQTNLSQPVLQLVMHGDFPGHVPQIYINVPARIDDTLPPGQSRGYTFLSEAGITWNIQVAATGNDGYRPRITLYGNEGQTLSAAEGDVDNPATLTYFVTEAGLFAVLLEGVEASGGSYTIRILPTDL